MEIQKLVSSNLRMYRSRLGYTQEQVAEKAGISTSAYANLERAVRGVSLETLSRLADALEVSITALLSEDAETRTAENLMLYLRGKPESFIIKVEQIIKTCAEIFDEDAAKHLQ